jgi:hypothetical protein
MALTQSMTGRGGSATIGGTVIPITKWSAKTSRNLADATDSSGYDPVTGQTWMSQAQGVVGMEVTIEGNYDLATTSTNVTSKIKTDGPFAVVLKVNPTTVYASGNFDFTDVETTLEVPGSTMVTWSVTAKSSGVITLP